MEAADKAADPELAIRAFPPTKASGEGVKPVRELMQLGGVLGVIAMTYGPVVLLLGLLNLRDRRESRLLGAVLNQFAARDFRGRLAVQVRCALLSPRGVVTVALRACSRDEVWEAVARVSRSLPPQVRLVVDGIADPRFLAGTRPAPDPSAPLWRPAGQNRVCQR